MYCYEKMQITNTVFRFLKIQIQNKDDQCTCTNPVSEKKPVLK